MGSKYLTKLNGGMMDKLMYVCGIVGPVSYTHLDVYKRQLQHRVDLLVGHLRGDALGGKAGEIGRAHV